MLWKKDVQYSRAIPVSSSSGWGGADLALSPAQACPLTVSALLSPTVTSDRQAARKPPLAWQDLGYAEGMQLCSRATAVSGVTVDKHTRLIARECKRNN